MMAQPTARQFDRKLGEILRCAAAVFCERGYHDASIRDISRATRVSLAGLYYYFQSKEQLLYLIQRHAFQTLLSGARRTLATLDHPEGRLRAFVRLHLTYFLEHPNEMKVLTHEEKVLTDEFRRRLKAIKKSYYRLCFDQVEALKRERHAGTLNTRLAVLSLFGMMNWIYTWHNPRIDPDADTMAAYMGDTFLNGAFGDCARSVNGTARVPARAASRSSQRTRSRRTHLSRLPLTGRSQPRPAWKTGG